MLPFLIPAGDLPFANGDYLFVPEIRKAVEEKADVIKAYVVKDGALVPFEMTLGALTDDEREIIRKGCLINYYRGQVFEKELCGRRKVCFIALFLRTYLK